MKRATVAALAAAVAAFFCAAANGAESTRWRPADGDETVLVLPALARAAAEERSLNDPGLVAARAETYAALARTMRDARYFGRAQALVSTWIERPDAPLRLLVAAADLAQQRHEFPQARRLLDRAIAAEPGHVSARLQRANVGLLLGDFDAARADCRALAAGGEVLPGTICLAGSMTGPGSVARARRLLASLDGPRRMPPAISQWLLLTEADLALRESDETTAIRLLERAHALDPSGEETRARLAEALLDRGEAVRAFALASGENVSAALLVVRVRAASRIDVGEARAARRELDALLAVGRQRGTSAHLREEGLLALHADGNARRALGLARRNFEVQKDTSDLRLLVEAAITAGDRPTLHYLRGWLADTGFEDIVVAARLAEAGA